MTIIKVLIDLPLLSAARSAWKRSDTPDADHASETLLRKTVVWRSMTSVTIAGDGGSEEANDSDERAGVRAGTTKAVDAGVLL